MNNSELFRYAILLLIFAIFYIATTATGLKCNNAQTDQYRKDNTSDNNFLIVSLVMAILSMLIAFYGIYASYTSPPSYINVA